MRDGVKIQANTISINVDMDDGVYNHLYRLLAFSLMNHHFARKDLGLIFLEEWNQAEQMTLTMSVDTENMDGIAVAYVNGIGIINAALAWTDKLISPYADVRIGLVGPGDGTKYTLTRLRVAKEWYRVFAMTDDGCEKYEYKIERDFATGTWYVIDGKDSNITKSRWASVGSALAFASRLVIRDIQIDIDWAG